MLKLFKLMTLRLRCMLANLNTMVQNCFIVSVVNKLKRYSNIISAKISCQKISIQQVVLGRLTKMLAIWLLSVSFCLYYEGVIAKPKTGQTSNPQDFGSAVLSRRTLLKPYLSEHEVLYAPYYQNNGRCVLRADLKTKFKKPLSSENWTKIHNLPTTISETNLDSILSNSEVAIQIYKCVLHLLLKRMVNWLYSGEKVTAILYNLGYEGEIVDLVNMSMTELFSLQRKRLVEIDTLAQIFYYSWDVEHMIGGIKDVDLDTEIVRKMFIKFLSLFGFLFTPDNNITYESNDTLVDTLKSNLRSIDEKTNASFGITIKGMKFWILIYESNDEDIILLKKRKASPSLPLLSIFVGAYSNEKDHYKINAYHLQILGVVATHAFGYVSNHFNLLSLLRMHKLNKHDQLVVEEFRPFLSAYMSVFIDRYFEFSGEISQELVDALFPLLYFLDPSDPQIPDVKYLREEEKSILNTRERPKISIYNYYFDPKYKEDDEMDGEMWRLINNAVQKLIETFTDEDLSNWNQLTRIEYGGADKSVLLGYMSANTKSAINILTKFAYEFSNLC